MILIEQLQRWVAIVEQFSDERAELVVSEMRDAIELMRISTPETYLVSTDPHGPILVEAASEDHAIGIYFDHFKITGSRLVKVEIADDDILDVFPVIRGKPDA